MDERIRRTALSAAAKTAIIVSLSGCYGMHERPPRAASPDAAPRPTDAAVLADAGPPPTLDAGGLPCGELLASLDIENPGPPDERWAWGAHFPDESVRLDPAVGACCLELEVRSEGEEPPIDVGGPLAMACCDVIVSAQHLVSSSSLGCTPWGPPCPPEMNDEDFVVT